jgi:hypothetical protein
MATGILTDRMLDVLNRASEIQRDIEFCRGGGHKEMRYFMDWLGNHVRSELGRENWDEPEVGADQSGTWFCLNDPSWRVGNSDKVAFEFWMPNVFDEWFPSVMVSAPAEKVFPLRGELLHLIGPKLKRAGFTDEVLDPSIPFWNIIRLEEFHRESGFNLNAFVEVIVEGFRRLLTVEDLIGNVFRSLPEKPPSLPSQRGLRTIAILDTESSGLGHARGLTELAIVNVAYDSADDEVVGVLEEYSVVAGQIVDDARAWTALKRADVIVAHNASSDRSLLARHLPGVEKLNWLCSLQVEWKALLGVQNEQLETLLGKTGLRYEQDHTALADARDLKNLLARKHMGRTYLGRLLDRSETEC